MGLPQEFISSLEQCPATGGYFVTLTYPQLIPVMKYASNEGTRKRMYLAEGRKAVPENVQILQELTALRLDCARCLGYSSNADFRLEVNMAKNLGTAQAFLDTMADALQPKLKNELDKLQGICHGI